MQAPRLDRIVRGRAWIPVLGAMLVAIVGLRVAVLKLGANVGSQIQQATLLESSNTTLRTRISALSDNQRILKLAEAYGMHMPNPLDVHFVSAAAGTHVQAAIHGISTPANSTYLSGLAAEQQHDQALTQATASLSAVGATTGVTTGTTGGTTSDTTGATTVGGVTATGGTASTTGATTGAVTGVTGSTTGTAGETSAGTSATGTGAGTVQTSGTTGTDSTATQSTGSSGLNTGVTNTDPSSNASQPTGGATSGGTGLAG